MGSTPPSDEKQENMTAQNFKSVRIHQKAGGIVGNSHARMEKGAQQVSLAFRIMPWAKFKGLHNTMAVKLRPSPGFSNINKSAPVNSRRKLTSQIRGPSHQVSILGGP